MTEYTDEELKRRAERAHRLLEDDILTEAFETARQIFQAEWANSDPSEQNIREIAWAKVRSLEEVKRVLETIVAEGEFIEASEEKLATMKGRR